MPNPIYEKLHETKLAEFLQGKDVFTVREEDTVETVIRLLNEKNIHSCPVLSSTGACVGIIDMLAIMKHVVTICPPQEVNNKYDLEVASRAIAWKKIGDLVVEYGTPFVSLNMDEPASMVLEVFSSGSQIHRSPVLSPSGEVVDTVSQSDLVRWLYEQSQTYLKRLDAWDLKLEEAGMGKSEVVTIRDADLVIDVLRTMASENLYAVAIVNKEGNLIGNFSATDLKAMCEENWPSFFSTVSEYLANHSPASLMTEGLSLDFTTIGAVLSHFNESPQHRVWILNDGKPIGLVTHTDILQFAKNYGSDD